MARLLGRGHVDRCRDASTDRGVRGVTLPTDLCGALRGARERLCIAQTHAEWPGHRDQLGEAIDTVDRIGVFSCPDWSKYDVPDVEEPTT